MMWLYVGLVAVVCGAVPVTVWLKRAGDKAWAEQVRRRRQAQLTVTLFANTEGFVRAMQEIGREVTRMQETFAQLGRSPAMRKLARDVRRMQRGGRP